MIDIIDGEIGHVSGGFEVWLEGSADGAEAVPINTMEERMRFDFDTATWTALGAETVLDVAKHAIEDCQLQRLREGGLGDYILSDAVLRDRPRRTTAIFGFSQGIIFREVQCLLPVDNLSIGVMGVLGTERGPAYQALKHDGSNGPPVTAEGVALAIEDFGSDVVGGANGGVSEATPRLAPCVHH